MGNRKKIEMKLVLILTLLLVLIPTSVASAINKKQMEQTILEEQNNESLLSETSNINFEGITIYCKMIMEGNGVLKHRWIGDWARLCVDSTDSDFNTEVTIWYLTHDESQDTWSIENDHFNVTGPQHIRYTTRNFDFYWPPGFDRDGVIFNKWHDRFNFYQWGIGNFYFQYWGHLRIPEFTLPKALELIKEWIFLGIPIGEWLYNILYKILPNGVFPETEIPWPGYLKIY